MANMPTSRQNVTIERKCKARQLSGVSKVAEQNCHNRLKGLTIFSSEIRVPSRLYLGGNS